MVYIQLDKTKVNEYKDQMDKKAKELLGEPDAAGQFIFEDTSTAECQIEGNMVQLIQTTPIATLSMSHTLNDDELMEIVNFVKARANKVKELLKLAD